MIQRYEIAIIGADSAIAEAVMELLVERHFPAGEMSALVLDPDSEATVDFAGRPMLLDDARSFDFGQVQLAFLTDAHPELAAEAERAADAGVIVIDAAAHPWRDSSIPLAVADLNPKALSRVKERGIAAAPDRLVVALAPVLGVLDALIGLREVSVTALLPASDFGRAALEDLARETTALLNARFYERQHYARQIAFNVLPQDADCGPDGQTERERRITDELREVLGQPALRTNVTLVPVPVFYGLSAVVEVRGADTVSLEAAVEALQGRPGIELRTSVLAEEAPTPVTDAALNSALGVSRLRLTPGGLGFWLTADNIRRCAAQNAVASAEIVVRDYL